MNRTLPCHKPNHSRPIRGLALLFGLTMGLSVSAQQTSGGDSDGAGEVDRLRGLLERFHYDSSQDIPVPEEPAMDLLEVDPPPSQSELNERLAKPYSAEKILLREDELDLLVNEIQRRMNDPLLEAPRKESPMIGSLQSREGGALVDSFTFSFTPVGAQHYVASTPLRRGRNTLTVVDKQWRIDLAEGGGVEEHLLFLYIPPLDNWELHALPATAFTTPASPLPPWLERVAGSSVNEASNAP